MKQLCLVLVMLWPGYLVALFSAGDEFFQWRLSPTGRGLTLLIVVCGLVGIAYFVVDAIRREYEADRTLPIALAIAGVFSFGLTTIAYFMVWGWRDRHVAYKSDFCETCTGETSEVTTDLDLTTVNFVNGGRLVGSAEQCETCGSTIKTHGFYLFGIPMFSRGSFRVQCPAMGQYMLRKRPFYRPHVLQIALMPAVLLGFALAIYLSID
ncbi:MAG: hypothetical protein ABGZ17_12345 [Planctomycetaceae bacterium]